MTIRKFSEGATKNPRRTGLTGFLLTNSISQLDKIVANTNFISNLAKAMARHIRLPPPNGKYSEEEN
jgi:hypothetical protein